MVWGVALYLRNRPADRGSGARRRRVHEAVRRVRAARAGDPRGAAVGGLAPGGGRAGWLGSSRSRRRAWCRSSGCSRSSTGSRRRTTTRSAKPVGAGPFAHLGHMLSYAASQTSPHGPRGIASYPFEWLVDYKPIVYLNVNPAQPGRRAVRDSSGRPLPGADQPADPARGGAGARRGRRRRAQAIGRAADRDVAVLAVSWFLGTFLPFLLLSLVWQRTSYIYYMLVVMPGLYVAAAWLAARLYRRPRSTGVRIATGSGSEPWSRRRRSPIR